MTWWVPCGDEIALMVTRCREFLWGLGGMVRETEAWSGVCWGVQRGSGWVSMRTLMGDLAGPAYWGPCGDCGCPEPGTGSAGERGGGLCPARSLRLGALPPPQLLQ